MDRKNGFYKTLWEKFRDFIKDHYVQFLSGSTGAVAAVILVYILKDFGRIQIDRMHDMQKWADNIKAIQDERIKLAIVAANNHYAGFGPGTVNTFRNMLGLKEAKWEEKEEEQEEQLDYPSHDLKQRTLTDFLS